MASPVKVLLSGMGALPLLLKAEEGPFQASLRRVLLRKDADGWRNGPVPVKPDPGRDDGAGLLTI